MASAQLEVRTEAQLTLSDGDNTPLWLNANKYGLSSLDTSNGYLRAGVFRSSEQDSMQVVCMGFGVDMAVAAGFTSDVVAQQVYGEIGWKRVLLTIGSKEQPMELKNQELSTGPQTLGINARPLPSVRLSLPNYWDIPGTRGWLSLKGHVSYGLTTDDAWQRSFSEKQNKYTQHTMVHTKAGYLRIGHADKPLTVELGLEMATQFGGTSYANVGSTELVEVKNEGGVKAMWDALIPGGHETVESDYKNVGGNHLGSMLARVNLDYAKWGVSAYVDHFFEDHSQMFFFCRDDYGEGAEWDSHVRKNYFVYDFKDALWGLELRLKDSRWLSTVVAEYVYTKYQSGPVYHDHTLRKPDQIAGRDNYYNHYVFTGWQHWGQVMGNPLYRSPLYNTDAHIMVENNRFWAWHLAAAGSPFPDVRYRLMATWQRGFGTYDKPLPDPRHNFSLLAEAAYCFPDCSVFAGWNVKGGLGWDRGGLLGDNVGFQLTIGRKFYVNTKR